jgi:hypothetical protein
VSHDGPPDHTYKVAYEEAGALLDKPGVEPFVGNRVGK